MYEAVKAMDLAQNSGGECLQCNLNGNVCIYVHHNSISQHNIKFVYALTDSSLAISRLVASSTHFLLKRPGPSATLRHKCFVDRIVPHPRFQLFTSINNWEYQDVGNGDRS